MPAPTSLERPWRTAKVRSVTHRSASLSPCSKKHQAASPTAAEQIDAQTTLVAADQRRYDLADLRYRKGVDSYLSVLTAQQDLYRAQQRLIQARQARLTNLVQIYKALGGGWLERSADSSARGDASVGRDG
jgi:multidrug efflux system outer membrane protein